MNVRSAGSAYACRACVYVCFEFQFQFVVPRSAFALPTSSSTLASFVFVHSFGSVRLVCSALRLFVPFVGLVGISLLIWLVVFLASLSTNSENTQRIAKKLWKQRRRQNAKEAQNIGNKKKTETASKTFFIHNKYSIYSRSKNNKKHTEIK